MSIHHSTHDLPRAIGIKQPGVQSWVQLPQAVTGLGVETIAVAAHQCTDLVLVVKTLLGMLAGAYPIILRWSTTGSPISGNVMQIRKAQIGIRERIAGFSAPTVDEPGPQGIPTRVEALELPFSQDHISALTNYTHVLLILARTPSLTPEETLAALRPFAEGLYPDRSNRIQALARDFLTEGRLIARFYDDGCTYCVAEFVGKRVDIEHVETVVRDLGVRSVSTREEIVEFVRTR